MECAGFTSIAILAIMQDVMDLSRMASTFLLRSMFADQPYPEVVSTPVESAMRELTMTFTTLTPGTSFMSFVGGTTSAFSTSSITTTPLPSMTRPSLDVLLSFLQSNSFSSCTQKPVYRGSPGTALRGPSSGGSPGRARRTAA